jgi:hypothetical protein
MFTRADATVVSRVCWRRRIRRKTMAVWLTSSSTILLLLAIGELFMVKWSQKKGALRDIRAPSSQGLASSIYQEEVEREAAQVREAMEGMQSLGE